MTCSAECGETATFYVSSEDVVLPLCENCAKNAEFQGYEAKPVPPPSRTSPPPKVV